MKTKLFGVVILVGVSAFGTGYDRTVWRAMTHGAEFDVLVKVVDDEGDPVANAKCSGWMYTETAPKQGNHYSLHTDTNGLVRVAGKCGEWFSVVLSKEGYYDTMVDIKYPNHNASPMLVDGKWQPYGETRTVVLKRIKNPGRTCIFPRTPQSCRIPEFGRWIGFDLERADWVAPHGKGRYLDVLLKFTAMEKRLNDYKYAMEVSFTNNPYAGAYWLKKDTSSQLATVHAADSNATYQTSFKFVKEQSPGTQRHWDFLNSDSYLVFRTRTRSDEHGNLISAHYGTIVGQWLSELGFMILSDGCFNPVENDVNVEDGRALRDILRNMRNP